MCHRIEMSKAESLHPVLFSRLVDSLYIEALVMADEARSYFDRDGDLHQTAGSNTLLRLSVTCESLKVTTRLMHIIAWLMTQKAWQRGEITVDALRDPKYMLGPASPSDEAVVGAMPSAARDLVVGSQLLYDRVARLQKQMLTPEPVGSEGADGENESSPARDLLCRLERAF